MGDFDGWSRGIDLSAEDAAGDSVFTRFAATLLLPKVLPMQHYYCRNCRRVWARTCHRDPVHVV